MVLRAHLRLAECAIDHGRPRAARGTNVREPSYLSCCRRTISVIQLGANGDVQFGEVG